MEEQNAVRGQGFTLMVFGGLVALCSVFFILGMVVGRGQATPEAESIAETVPPAQSAAEEPESELELVGAAREGSPPEVRTTPAAPSPPPPPPPVSRAPVPEAPAPAIVAVPALPDAGSGAVAVQLGAFSVEATANRIAAEARAQGFNAFVLLPSDSSPLHKVQLGPYASEDEASRVRSQLEAAGIESMIVR